MNEIAMRYLGKYIDKTVRGQIQWRGLDDEVILYAANDVVDLTDIANKQIEICKKRAFLCHIFSPLLFICDILLFSL